MLAAIAAETAPVAASSSRPCRPGSATGRQPDRQDKRGRKRRRSDAGARGRGDFGRARGVQKLEPDAGQTRASILENAAHLLEGRASHFIALLQREGGKTLDDALSEVREAVDFCRYYAAEGRETVRRGRSDARPDRREQRT
jgi:RHH-type proline utilization regulon transcriptional repressor/proline dehydrogenase/delta 1-pyrroline-5-carboxylate dehydrogenase